MSTRTNIIVKVGKTTTHLYRHCDGYPAVTGADILDKVLLAQGTPEYRRTATGAASEFLRSVLTACYDGTSYDPRPRPIYEVTSDTHGDIEHLYYVTFEDHAKGARVVIRHAARPRQWDDDSFDVWTRATKRYSPEEFRALVNADRVAINQRIAQLKAQQPGSYANCEPYALV